jgi:hypothetical protein
MLTDCHICLKMQDRKPSHQQIGASTQCVLCDRPYCQAHKATTGREAEQDVCEINHRTYYENHKRLVEFPRCIFPNLETWWESL